MTRLDRSAPPSPIAPEARLGQRATLLGIAALLGLIVVQVVSLVREWRALAGERAVVRATTAVGYQDIAPRFEHGSTPGDWFRDEEAHSLLWAGWKDGQHDWFRIDRGDLTRDQLSGPFGRDAIRAIDHPVLEHGGGARWGRIPDEDLVVGVQVQSVVAAYPIRVLEKVEVVNDQIDQTSLLVVFTPFRPVEHAVGVFDPRVDDRRVTLGSSGYFLGGQPVLYDRWTRSLWVERADGVAAIAGPLKGRNLPRLDSPALHAWSAWRSQFPGARLLVGADRSRPTPDI